MHFEEPFRSRLLLTLCAMIVLAAGLISVTGSGLRAQPSPASDPRLQKAWRFQRGGWTYVHLEGSPSEIGYQHGTLLAAEIGDAFQAVKLQDTHNTGRDWDFFVAPRARCCGHTLKRNISRNCRASPMD